MLPASGQRALFLDEVPGIDTSAPFQGIVLVTSATPIAVTALRTRINERGDFLSNATLPKDDSESTVSATELFFPHFAVGGGTDMQFILINPQSSGADSGTIRFFAPSGAPLALMIP